MQENAVSRGNRDNRSQWPLWHFLALELRSSLHRSVSPKQIEQFFREVDGGGAGHDKLDSLLFPRDSPTSTSDDGTAADICETKDCVPPNEGWAETEVDAPQSQECSEKQASDAGRVVGMTESPSAEVTLVSKDGRLESDGAVDAVPVPINTDMLPAADPTDSASVFPESDALDDLWALFGEDPVVDNESTGDDVALTRRRAPACDVYDVAGGDREEGAAGSPVFHDGAATEPAFGDRPHSDACENGYSTDDDTQWSALDSEFAANSVDKETQCEFHADFMSELLSAETALRMEVVRLGIQLRKMQVHTE
ncbi:uncharacterized protein LOC125946986 [Dermacentor silvarum]|uniref:uncharacterized protein LOC125946986 n=1 Tax=Dermacentor silvarum TaxID=543639 RepID=UPI00210134E7|nr:uncharacterized protein LOC125946986 [Dermacentor silvarum]